MQSASVNFTEAVTGAGRVRADRLLVDWSSDGLVREVVREYFDRTVVDHWGTTTSGQLWNLNGDGAPVLDANWDVPGDGTGTIALPTAPAYRLTLLTTEAYGDEDFYAEFNCPAASGAALEPALLIGGTTAQTYLTAKLAVVAGGTFLIQLVERLDGVETLLGQAVPTLAHSAVTWYAIRFQRYGTDHRIRLWEAGTTEPSTWDVQVSYNGEVGIGFPGVKFGAATGNLNAKPVSMAWRNIRLTNGEFDDMSAQLGAWTVDHHLDDGLPDQVSFVAGTAVPTLRAEVIRPGHVPGRGRYTNRSFFSPYNTDSPIQSFPRDVPPATLEAGVVTEDGREYLPVFTGQSQDFVLRGDQVAFSAISAARLKLAALVHPPAVYGFYEGANATWLVSFALAACGVYASPPPQEGCRWWAPMHGSTRSFLPAANTPQINIALFAWNGDSASSGGSHVIDAPWVDGPFVSAPLLGYTDDMQAAIDVVSTGTGLAMEDGDDLLSQAGNTAKLEMWVRCDDALAAASSLVRLIAENNNGTNVDIGVFATTRRPFINIDDGVTSQTFIHTDALPTDGAWRFLGFAWKIDSPSKRWINIDGDVETDNTLFQTSGFPPADDFNVSVDYPRPIFRIPVAEVQLTAGPTANPDVHPWLMDISFAPGAQIVRSSANLVSIGERAPREAWEIVSSMALAELAMLRIDETDVVRYLGWRHWGQAAQQAVVDVLDTRRNLALPDVNIDPTKIVNAVSATFSEGFNVDLFTRGGSITDVITLPPGVTVLVLPTDFNIVELRGFSFTYIATATTTEPTTVNFISINLASDGTGAYATSSHVAVSVLDWHPGEVTIQFDNTSGATWYTANNKSFATVNVAGKLLDLKSRTVIESDDNSIAVRGERGLTLSLTALQRAIDARRTARRIVNDLSDGVPTIGRVTVRGHPGRQPGDLVTVVDPEAAVNDRFRIQSVYHDDDGELYTQQVVARRARQGGYWGIDAYWGETIWTTED